MHWRCQGSDWGDDSPPDILITHEANRALIIWDLLVRLSNFLYQHLGNEPLISNLAGWLRVTKGVRHVLGKPKLKLISPWLSPSGTKE